VKLRLNLTVVLGIVVVVLALVRFIRPFGGRGFEISLPVLIVVLALVGARYAARRQVGKREQMLKAVPRRPLGLADDSGDEH
jgi:hypothetical protein